MIDLRWSFLPESFSFLDTQTHTGSVIVPKNPQPQRVSCYFVFLFSLLLSQLCYCCFSVSSSTVFHTLPGTDFCLCSIFLFLFFIFFSFQPKTKQSYDADLMEPHTVIHVTPATPSSTDSSKTSATASNMLENLLDELQTFSKQSSMDSPSSSTAIPAGSHQRSSLRGALNSNAKQALLLNQSDTVVRKGDHSCSSTANQTASPSTSTSSSTSSSSNLPACSPPPDNSSSVNDVNEHDGNECRSVVEDSSAAAPECIPNEQHIRSTGQQIEQQQPPQSEPLQ